jgi:hypothetical protein
MSDNRQKILRVILTALISVLETAISGPICTSTGVSNVFAADIPDHEFHTHYQNPRNSVLSENLRVGKPVKKLRAFYEARRFITVFTRARISSGLLVITAWRVLRLRMEQTACMQMWKADGRILICFLKPFCCSNINV